MNHASSSFRHAGQPHPINRKPHRRPILRPNFDHLEPRILPTIPIAQFPLPNPTADTETNDVFPNSLVAASDGSLWYNSIYSGTIGRISADGTITQFSLDAPDRPSLGESANQNYVSMTEGPDGNIWLVGDQSVARVTPSGVVTTFPIGGPDAFSTHDEPSEITTGPDGALWFVNVEGSIGRITTAGVVTLFNLPNSYAIPSAITVGPDGALWFADGFAIGRISTDGTIREFPLDASGGAADQLAVGSDGDLWYSVQQSRLGGIDEIGRISPDGRQTYYAMPSWTGYTNSPTSLVAGPDGAVWFDVDAGLLGRIAPDGTITEYALPNPPESAGFGYTGVVMSFGPDDALWFTTGSTPPFGSNILATHEIDRVQLSDILPLVAQSDPISSVAGSVFDGTVATFRPTVPDDSRGDFTSTIDWGDGTTSNGMLTQEADGSYVVNGSHTFSQAGARTATVTLTLTTSAASPILVPDPVTVLPFVGPMPVPRNIPGPGPATEEHSGPPVAVTSVPSATPVVSSLPIPLPPIIPSFPPAAAPPSNLKVAVAKVTGSNPGPLSTSILSQLDPLTIAAAQAATSASSAPGTPQLILSTAISSNAGSRTLRNVPTLNQAPARLGGPWRSSTADPSGSQIARSKVFNGPAEVASNPTSPARVAAPR